MKKKFCPSCGKETENLVEGLCKECFKEDNAIGEIPEKIELERCKKCGRFRLGGNWEIKPLDEAVKDELEGSIKSDSRSKDVEMNINLQGENRAIVELSGELKNQKLKTREEVDIKFSDQLCDSCSKINSGYFEAKLQIRGPGDKLDEALNISRRIIEKSGGDKEFASDVERVKNGFDIFIGSNSLAKKMARKIASEFDTERKDSKTLHGEKDGQRIYRSTYLVRILD